MLNQSNRVWEDVNIIGITGQTGPILGNHARRPNRIQIEHFKTMRITLVTEYPGLTRLAVAKVGAGGAIVGEERVQTGADDTDLLGVDDS